MDMAQGVSKATARHDLKSLRAAVNYYHREHGPLPSVPAFTLPPKPGSRDRWLRRREAGTIIHKARRGRYTGFLARFILIGLYTGTRSGAILRLRWLPSVDGGWIDLEAGVIHRRGSGEAESRKRQAPARIPDRLLAHLRRWHAADSKRGITTVVHFYGKQIRKLRRSWKTVREAAELGPDVVPHSLRHTAATWLMQAGVDRHEAAGLLGMSIGTLEEVYGHHHPDFQKRAASALSRRS